MEQPEKSSCTFRQPSHQSSGCNDCSTIWKWKPKPKLFKIFPKPVEHRCASLACSHPVRSLLVQWFPPRATAYLPTITVLWRTLSTTSTRNWNAPGTGFVPPAPVANLRHHLRADLLNIIVAFQLSHRLSPWKQPFMLLAAFLHWNVPSAIFCLSVHWDSTTIFAHFWKASNAFLSNWPILNQPIFGCQIFLDFDVRVHEVSAMIRWLATPNQTCCCVTAMLG